VLSNREESYKYNLQGPNGFRFLVQTVVNLRTQACALSPSSKVRGLQKLGGRRAALRPTLLGMAFQQAVIAVGLLLLVR